MDFLDKYASATSGGFPVYLFGKCGYPSIRPVSVIALEDPKYKQVVDNMFKTRGIYYSSIHIHVVHVFPFLLTDEHIKQLVNAGFRKFDIGQSCSYMADLEEHKDKVKYVHLSGLKKVILETEKVADKWRKQFRKMNIDDAFLAYEQNMREIYDKLGIPYFMTVDEAKKYVEEQNWDVQELVDFQIEKGDKNMLGDALPQLEIYLTEPIPYKQLIKYVPVK